MMYTPTEINNQNNILIPILLGIVILPYVVNTIAEIHQTGLIIEANPESFKASILLIVEE